MFCADRLVRSCLHYYIVKVCVCMFIKCISPFFAQQQIRLVVEEGLNQLPYSECTVTTPTGEVISLLLSLPPLSLSLRADLQHRI